MELCREAVVLLGDIERDTVAVALLVEDDLENGAIPRIAALLTTLRVRSQPTEDVGRRGGREVWTTAVLVSGDTDLPEVHVRPRALRDLHRFDAVDLLVPFASTWRPLNHKEPDAVSAGFPCLPGQTDLRIGSWCSGGGFLSE